VTPPLHAIRQTEQANLGCAWSRLLSAQRPHVRLYSIQRPCDGTSRSKSCWPSVIPPGPIGSGRRPQPEILRQQNGCRQPTCDAAPPPVCGASATFARFIPRSFATRSAHAFNVENCVTRLSITLAASNKAVRTIASPTLLIRPVQSTSPEEGGFGPSVPPKAPGGHRQLVATACVGTPGWVVGRDDVARSPWLPLSVSDRDYQPCHMAVFRFPLGLRMVEELLLRAASSSATKPCGSGRANSASSSPIRSVDAFLGLATSGIWMRSCSSFPG
jgi:hypothetical protein